MPGANEVLLVPLSGRNFLSLDELLGHSVHLRQQKKLTTGDRLEVRRDPDSSVSVWRGADRQPGKQAHPTPGGGRHPLPSRPQEGRGGAVLRVPAQVPRAVSLLIPDPAEPGRAPGREGSARGAEFTLCPENPLARAQGCSQWGAPPDALAFPRGRGDGVRGKKTRKPRLEPRALGERRARGPEAHSQRSDTELLLPSSLPPGLPF